MANKAVDEYITLDPELVVISLDIPSLDGHLTALEMREHGGDARIVFVAPRRLANVAADAKFSAGAVAWLQKTSYCCCIRRKMGDNTRTNS